MYRPAHNTELSKRKESQLCMAIRQPKSTSHVAVKFLQHASLCFHKHSSFEFILQCHFQFKRSKTFKLSFNFHFVNMPFKKLLGKITYSIII